MTLTASDAAAGGTLEPGAPGLEEARSGAQQAAPAPITARVMGYVPALDGLRALSVVVVIAFHTGQPWLPGGFLGVDVFFVLSGFLITTLLLEEWRAHTTIDVVGFWGRRLRRLMPALLLVVASTLVLAGILGNARGASNGRDALGSLLYVNNWNQVLDRTDYFDTFLGASPLLHTWSLGIEEQFYLLWPLVLIWLLVRRRLDLPGLGALILALVLVSTGLMWWHYQAENPTPAYVATDARLATIGVGAAAAVLLQWQGDLVRSWLRRWFARPLPALCLLGLLGCMAVANQDSGWLFQWGFLVVAVVAALLIVCLVHGPRGTVARLMSTRPATAIGEISYGLYLWHWPVIVLLGAQTLQLTGTRLVLVQLAIMTAAATASYVLVERPIRRRALRRRFGVAGERATLSIAFIVVLVGALAVSVGGSAAIVANGSERTFSSGSGDTSVFVYGDSVVFGLLRDFESGSQPGLSVSGSSKLGCPALPQTNWVDGAADPPAEDCQEWYDTWQDALLAANADLAVLPASQWSLFDVVVDGDVAPLGSQAWATTMTAQLDSYVDAMAEASPHVVLVNQPCYRVFDDGRSPYARTIDDDSRVATYNDFLAEYAEQRGLPVLDIYSWLCGPGEDPEERDGVKTRIEGLHFTADGAQLVWAWLAPQLIRIAAQPLADEPTSTTSPLG